MTLNVENRQRISTMLMRAMTVVMTLILLTTVALAENEYAKNASTWILDGAFWIIICLGIIGLGSAFVKRNITLGIGIGVGAGVAAYLCQNPEKLSTLGNKLAQIIGL